MVLYFLTTSFYSIFCPKYNLTRYPYLVKHYVEAEAECHEEKRIPEEEGEEGLEDLKESNVRGKLIQGFDGNVGINIRDDSR